MSADQKQPNGEERMLPVKRRRSLAWHVTRAGSWAIGGVLALVILLVGGITWFTTTAYFQRRVERRLCRCWRTRLAGGGGAWRAVQPVAPEVEVDG